MFRRVLSTFPMPVRFAASKSLKLTLGPRLIQIGHNRSKATLGSHTMSRLIHFSYPQTKMPNNQTQSEMVPPQLEGECLTEAQKCPAEAQKCPKCDCQSKQELHTRHNVKDEDLSKICDDGGNISLPALWNNITEAKTSGEKVVASITLVALFPFAIFSYVALLSMFGIVWFVIIVYFFFE